MVGLRSKGTVGQDRLDREPGTSGCFWTEGSVWRGGGTFGEEGGHVTGRGRDQCGMTGPGGFSQPEGGLGARTRSRVAGRGGELSGTHRSDRGDPAAHCPTPSLPR